MKHNVGYNSQRDNLSFGGKFPGFWQCFTTCAWMLISFYTPEKYRFNDDTGLAGYLDDVEATVGKPGIGEAIRKKYNWITGHTSEWWAVQQAGITAWLNRAGVAGSAVFCDQTVDFADLPKLIERGPVILGTKKLGGLPGGHIILAIGYEPGGIICNDPYGNAVTNYKGRNGEAAFYSDALLQPATGQKIRCMYWQS